jgi:hypothetical protein
MNRVIRQLLDNFMCCQTRKSIQIERQQALILHLSCTGEGQLAVILAVLHKMSLFPCSEGHWSVCGIRVDSASTEAWAQAKYAGQSLAWQSLASKSLNFCPTQTFQNKVMFQLGGRSAAKD